MHVSHRSTVNTCVLLWKELKQWHIDSLIIQVSFKQTHLWGVGHLNCLLNTNHSYYLFIFFFFYLII